MFGHASTPVSGDDYWFSATISLLNA